MFSLCLIISTEQAGSNSWAFRSTSWESSKHFLHIMVFFPFQAVMQEEVRPTKPQFASLPVSNAVDITTQLRQGRISSGCHWFPTGGHCGRKERWYAWGKIKVLSEICSSIAFFFRLRECSWRPGAAVMRCMHCSYSLPYSHRKLMRWGKKFPELSVLVKEAAVLILIPSILLQTEMLQNSSEEQKRKTYTSVWHS